MEIRTFIIDAFTNKAFKGNPAGVCLLDEAIDVETMQAIATELNLSETAFLMQDKEDDTTYSIRYYTPTVEIAFCGHATLASAKLILNKFKKEKVEFVTAQNLSLTAVPAGDQIKMKFPLYDTIAYDPGAALYHALGITAAVNTQFSKALSMLLIEITDKEELIKIDPDFSKLTASSEEIKEVVITVRSIDPEYDFYSRCFCPWIGINEDPVTGAAHTLLASYWSKILGKQEMMAYQLSKRGGFMKLAITGKQELEVSSEAVIVFEGILNY
jgi:PhzF family phenazine biosynthesis protein